MKWFKSKYTYLLIILSLLVSSGLQIVWLRQLFLAQQKQLQYDIEHFVSTTVQAKWYLSITSFEKPHNIQRISQLFLSPQWEQMRQAFDNMKSSGLTSNYSINSSDDSTSVSMNFSLKDVTSKSNSISPTTYNTGKTPAQLLANDSLALSEINKAMDSGLRKMDITSAKYYNVYAYDMTSLYESNVPKGFKPAYISKKYMYGIQNHYRFQLCLPAINNVVWYRMRYYVASSIFMILLTCTAFYFILKLLRNQQLYADAKADFTSNMTHEFKTPIATVSVALESINKYNLVNSPETLQNYLDISQHELRRLDLMVEKILNISNGNDSDQPLKPELYDVQSGLSRVISSMQPQLLKRRANIRFNPSPEPCFVFGDPIHLTNIFHNLIDNAIKYSKANLVMQIDCTFDLETVMVSFKDNGPGIDKIYHKKIFEKFFRVPVKGATHDIKGSGLGLHYVKQIVEKHNGKISIKSEPGSGTCFIINLPAVS